jgi:hypothetical protein
MGLSVTIGAVSRRRRRAPTKVVVLLIDIPVVAATRLALRIKTRLFIFKNGIVSLAIDCSPPGFRGIRKLL